MYGNRYHSEVPRTSQEALTARSDRALYLFAEEKLTEGGYIEISRDGARIETATWIGGAPAGKWRFFNPHTNQVIDFSPHIATLWSFGSGSPGQGRQISIEELLGRLE